MKPFIRIGPDPDHGGLAAIWVSTPHCEAKLFLFGANLNHFQPTGMEPVLFTSERAVYDEKKAIRGGIPICFPWFNAHPTDASLPSHGYARIREWTLESHTYVEETETAELVLALEIAPYALRYRIQLRDSLIGEITVTNLSDEPQRAELVFHTYYRVGDIGSVEIDGFGEAPYLDQLEEDRPKRLTPKETPIRIAAEYDRVFPAATERKQLVDSKWKRVVQIEKERLDSSVVWNPWIEKAARLSDLGNQEWRDFVCIESGAVGDDALHLAPRESMTSVLRVTAELLSST